MFLLKCCSGAKIVQNFSAFRAGAEHQNSLNSDGRGHFKIKPARNLGRVFYGTVFYYQPFVYETLTIQIKTCSCRLITWFVKIKQKFTQHSFQFFVTIPAHFWKSDWNSTIRNKCTCVFFLIFKLELLKTNIKTQLRHKLRWILLFKNVNAKIILGFCLNNKEFRRYFSYL